MLLIQKCTRQHDAFMIFLNIFFLLKNYMLKCSYLLKLQL